MIIQLLGQGYDPISANSVGNILIKFLNDKNFTKFTAISAFASQAGIKGLSIHIKNAKEYFDKLTIIVGVDQKGTSKEALEALLDLQIDAFIFYHPTVAIFHPKIYLFEGEKRTEIIIGSSNFTAQGLFTNIETSIHVSINNNIDSDKKVLSQLKEYFEGLFNHSDPNLKRLSDELISKLVEAKIVPDESERKEIQDNKEVEYKETNNIISGIFPKRAIPKIPKEFRGRKTSKSKKVAMYKKGEPKIFDAELLWESGALTERDLNIPHGTNTNPTGSMLFKKGKTKDIDQRHYFRETVFADLIWEKDINPKRSHFERALGNFQIIIDGIDYGIHELKLSHNTKTDTPSYAQRNSMTWISWGKAKEFIAKNEHIGKSFRLFKNKDNPDEFTLIME
jgi:HKD family nuclease